MPQSIDFHSHYYAPVWGGQSPAPAALARAWPLLTDLDAQFAALDGAGIAVKVLTAPGSVLVAPGAALPLDLMQRINDQFAALVATYPQRLFALATIDAFAGEAALQEAERAIRTLGLHGLCIDCARGDLWLDAPAARPLFELAAALGVTVFVHPVSPVALTRRLSSLGHTGVLLARGTETAASLLAFLRSGLLDALPTLRVVLPMIGAATLLFSGMADQEEGWQGTTPSLLRQRLYVDTMGFDPAMIRFATQLLGVQHVVFGSDWPIMPLTPLARIESVLQAAGLTPDEQQAVLHENAQQLLTPLAPAAR
ncbi:MAG: amidohydrolase family protein [Ktedonobacterales bacterium]|nr:amidohydrolase family protein [Ktedonobacterales bacterium]